MEVPDLYGEVTLIVPKMQTAVVICCYPLVFINNQIAVGVVVKIPGVGGARGGGPVGRFGAAGGAVYSLAVQGQGFIAPLAQVPGVAAVGGSGPRHVILHRTVGPAQHQGVIGVVGQAQRKDTLPQLVLSGDFLKRITAYQRSRFTFIISTERLFLKIAIIIARPTTASAAATDKENKTRICPPTSPW